MTERLTTIYLIRHGEVDNPDKVIYGRSVDVSLTERGFEQMRTLGRELLRRGVKPDVIFRSPLRRSIQSVEALLEIFPGIPIVEEERITDTEESVIAGKTLDWLAARGGDEYDIEGVESPKIIIERMNQALEEIRQKYLGKTIFVIGHGDPIAFTKWYLLNPDKPLKSIGEIKKEGNYPQKGGAWRATFNQGGRIAEHELISL